MTLLIKKLRQEKRWSQRKLAGESGVPRSTIDELENHKKLPRAGELEKIARALGITVDSLYKKEG